MDNIIYSKRMHAFVFSSRTKICETDMKSKLNARHSKPLTDELQAFPLEMQAGERVKNDNWEFKINFSHVIN